MGEIDVLASVEVVNKLWRQVVTDLIQSKVNFQLDVITCAGGSIPFDDLSKIL